MLNRNSWTPWTELAGLHRDLDSIFSRMFGETGTRQSVESFVPAANVWRGDEKWMLSMALPGISPDKVDIDIVGHTLRVRGERIPSDPAGNPRTINDRDDAVRTATVKEPLQGGLSPAPFGRIIFS